MSRFDLRGAVLGQDTGQVLSDAAAGDVGHANGDSGGAELLDDVEIAAVGFHEGRARLLLMAVTYWVGL